MPSLVQGNHTRARHRDDDGGRLYVDRRESALTESGDYLLAARRRDRAGHIRGELGELVLGTVAGRGRTPS